MLYYPVITALPLIYYMHMQVLAESKALSVNVLSSSVEVKKDFGEAEACHEADQKCEPDIGIQHLRQ